MSRPGSDHKREVCRASELCKFCMVKRPKVSAFLMTGCYHDGLDNFFLKYFFQVIGYFIREIWEKCAREFSKKPNLHSPLGLEKIPAFLKNSLVQVVAKLLSKAYYNLYL